MPFLIFCSIFIGKSFAGEGERVSIRDWMEEIGNLSALAALDAIDACK